MDDSDLRELVLRLAGPTRDRTRLARLVGVSESTAGGWIYMTEQGRFGLETSVRGEANKAAKSLLVSALEGIDDGSLADADVESFVLARAPAPDNHEAGESSREPSPERDEAAREHLRRGLAYAQRQIEAGASIERVVGALEAVIEMSKEEPMKH